MPAIYAFAIRLVGWWLRRPSSASTARAMKLLAVSDLHVNYRKNRELLESLPPRSDDWLILGGDLGEREAHLEHVLASVVPRFAKVAWVPGNHDLWTLASEGASGLRGDAKYKRLVDICRKHGVLTPEDPYELLPGDGPKTVLVPMFLLYDYSFRPAEIADEDALSWALEDGIRCADEDLLWFDPYPSRRAWCDARVKATEERLLAIAPDTATVLVNHFPLRRAHARLPLAPRFSIWCGTQRTDDWHRRFRARAVVYGHLHIARTHVDDGVVFEEVSLGYPYQRAMRRPRGLLREILPGAWGPT
jgi:predicted phosphodiesterase